MNMQQLRVSLRRGYLPWTWTELRFRVSRLSKTFSFFFWEASINGSTASEAEVEAEAQFGNGGKQIQVSGSLPLRHPGHKLLLQQQQHPGCSSKSGSKEHSWPAAAQAKTKTVLQIIVIILFYNLILLFVTSKTSVGCLQTFTFLAFLKP